MFGFDGPGGAVVIRRHFQREIPWRQCGRKLDEELVAFHGEGDIKCDAVRVVNFFARLSGVFAFMHALFLDLASNNGTIACVTDDRVISSFAAGHRIDDAALVPHVEDLLKKAEWSFSDLTHLACVNGPGGFTSLRVAVALANTLISQLKIPACAVHLSELYVVRSRSFLPSPPAPLPQAGEGGLFWFHSTKKTELFIRGFGSLAKDFPEPVCIGVDDLKKHVKKGIFWMGELIPEQRKIVDDVGAVSASLSPLQAILPEFLTARTYSNHPLAPWYGRGW